MLQDLQVFDLTTSCEDTDGDGQIKSRPGFADISRCQIYQQLNPRHLKTIRLQCTFNALQTFLDGVVRQTYNKVILAFHHVHFHGYRDGVHTINRTAIGFDKHACYYPKQGKEEITAIQLPLSSNLKIWKFEKLEMIW